MKWIKCSDRLPAHSLLVFISDGKRVSKGEYGIFEWNKPLGWKKVTHWMEIENPKPPKNQPEDGI